MEPTLHSRARRGVLWTSVANVCKGLAGLGTVVLLAYFLRPADLGIIGIVSVFYMLSESVTEFSIAQSVIARGTTDARELSSLLWLSVGLGIGVTAIVFAASGAIAQFFDQPPVERLLKTLVPVFLITPFGLVQRAMLQRELRFLELELVTIVRALVTVSATGLLLFTGFGVAGYIYALVLGAGISTIAYVVIFSRINSWHPLLVVSLQDIRPHYHFGLYVTTKQLANFSGRYLDEIIIAKLMGIEVLGIYHFARRLVEKPMFLLSSSFSRVSFPLLSKLMRDRERLTKTYMTLSAAVAAGACGAFGLLAALSPALVPTLFPERWSGSNVLIQIFCAHAAIYCLVTGFSTPVLYAAGRPRVVMLIDVGLGIASIALAFAAAQFAIELVAMAMLFIVLAKLALLQKEVNSEMATSLIMYLRHIAPPMIAAVGGFVSAVSVIHVLSPGSVVKNAILTTVTFLAIYLCALRLFDKNAFVRLRTVVLGRKGSLPSEVHQE